MKVLRLIGLGHSSKDASELLLVSKRTVDFHLANLFKVLQVKNRLLALFEAVRKGYLQLEEILPADFKAPRRVRFTDRELEVILAVLTHGASKKAADHLGIEKRTVDFHLANIYEKLGVSNRVQMLRAVLALMRDLHQANVIGTEVKALMAPLSDAA